MTSDRAKKFGPGTPHDEKRRHLTQMLSEGIASIRAGKIVTQDEFEQIIDAALAERAAERSNKTKR
jgi:hypothetical protein